MKTHGVLSDRWTTPEGAVFSGEAAVVIVLTGASSAPAGVYFKQESTTAEVECSGYSFRNDKRDGLLNDFFTELKTPFLYCHEYELCC